MSLVNRVSQLAKAVGEALRITNSDALYQKKTGLHSTFDSDFAQQEGGYPKGAELISNDGKTLYVSVADNNKENFNAVDSAQNWKPFSTVVLPTGGKKGQLLSLDESGNAKWTDDGIGWGASVEVGTLAMWPSETLPAGGKWMERNGDILSSDDYPDLFAIIGHIYGGSGTSFALPDDRGLVERGWDHGRGYDSARTFGSEQQDAIRNITGQFLSHASMQEFTGAFSRPPSTSDNRTINAVTNYGTQQGAAFNASAVVPTASENRMKNRAYLPIIKVLP